MLWREVQETQRSEVMKDPIQPTGSLYRSIRLLRHILPITAFLFVLVHQSLTYEWLHSPQWPAYLLWQVLPYATIGPIVVWLALSWFLRWASERDEAEAHLRCLHDISRQAASAADLEAIVDIALQMPRQLISPAATSLIWRDQPDGSWSLAGSHGLKEIEREMLMARLTIAGSDLYCGQCQALSATARQNCPLQVPLPQADMSTRITSVICLPLSTERPPLALLNIYLPGEEPVSKGIRRALESMAAVLSVALDHARLRTREFQMLQRMEQASRQTEGLAATLDKMLGDMIAVHRARSGMILLASPVPEKPGLAPIATWPAGEACGDLVSVAEKALLEEDLIIAAASQTKEHMIAIPLVVESLTVGVLALASQRTFSAAQQAFLRVGASMIALIIRNSQLYAQLKRQAVLEERNRLAREFHDGLAQGLGFLNFKMQQVDRLLAREEWEAARTAMNEMRTGLQELYTDVRQTIQDLRWFPEDGQSLGERLLQYVTEFSESTGLKVFLDIKGQVELSPQAEVHLLRIVQEALTNVHRHAQAEHAWVRLQTNLDATLLEIEDDGKGLLEEASAHCDTAPAEASGHFGLRIMQERAEAIGGELSLQSLPGRGTRLQVRLGSQHPVDPYAVSTASRSG
ncbi:MAG: hypothetical protein Kow0063_33510 [Anaerolineae bacterium]